MAGATPVYGLPYPTASDALRDAVSTIPEQQARDIESTLLGLQGVPAPGSWVTATQGASWSSLTGYSPVGYRKVATEVKLRGAPTNGQAGNAPFFLPVGYRPGWDMRFLVPSTHASGFSWVRVRATDGAVYTDVNSVGGAGQSYWLDGIKFDI